MRARSPGLVVGQRRFSEPDRKRILSISPVFVRSFVSLGAQLSRVPSGWVVPMGMVHPLTASTQAILDRSVQWCESIRCDLPVVGTMDRGTVRVVVVVRAWVGSGRQIGSGWRSDDGRPLLASLRRVEAGLAVLKCSATIVLSLALTWWSCVVSN